MDWKRFDMVLFSLAFALTVMALFLSRPQPRVWEIARLFMGIQGKLDLRGQGEPWQPSEWLGAGATWEGLMGGQPAVDTALLRRLKDLRLVCIAPDTLSVAGLVCHSLQLPELPPEGLTPAFEAVVEAVLQKHRRLVLVAGSQAMPLLKLLHVAPGLRDRVQAVVLLDPVLDSAWLKDNFNHVSMDTELYRTIPYLLMHQQALPSPLQTPPLPQTGRAAIDVVDLGVVSLQDPQFARHLGLLLAALA